MAERNGTVKKRYDTNVCVFTGHLGRDVEARFTPEGTKVYNGSMAVSNGENSMWIDLTLWGGREGTKDRWQGVHPYLHKGAKILASGELSTREWTDKEGGKRLSVGLNVNKIELIKTDGPNNGAAGGDPNAEIDPEPF